MTIHIESLGPATLSVTIDGKLEKSDYTTLRSMVEKRLETHDKVGMMLVIREFKGWTAAAFWEDIKFDVAHYNSISRFTIVGEDTSKKWVATLSKPFTGAEVKFFLAADIEAARRWTLEGENR